MLRTLELSWRFVKLIDFKQYFQNDDRFFQKESWNVFINGNVFKADATTYFLNLYRVLRNFIGTNDLKFIIKYKKLIKLGQNGSENACLIPTTLILLLMAKIYDWEYKSCFLTQIGKLRWQFWCEINLINYSDYTTIEISVDLGSGFENEQHVLSIRLYSIIS